jgi:uncharacterized membrane protein YsdA (DUF1294 family)
VDDLTGLLTSESYLMYLFIVNILTAILFGGDKLAAMFGSDQRIPEVVLLGTMFAGGIGGAFAGLLLFNHKTAHGSFWLSLVVATVMHLVLGVGLITSSGA